jgi:hypothetical protein
MRSVLAVSILYPPALGDTAQHAVIALAPHSTKPQIHVIEASSAERGARSLKFSSNSTSFLIASFGGGFRAVLCLLTMAEHVSSQLRAMVQKERDGQLLYYQYVMRIRRLPALEAIGY